MKIVDIGKNIPSKKTKYETAIECVDAAYSLDSDKEFFLLTIDKEGLMGVYSSLDYPVAYMALDGAKMVLMEYYTDESE